MAEEFKERVKHMALAHELKLSNTEDALALVRKYVPEQLLVPRIRYLIEEISE